MGYTVGDIRRIRSAAIGTEVGRYESDSDTRSIIRTISSQPRFRPREEAMLARYVDDMRQVVRETARVLAGGGKGSIRDRREHGLRHVHPQLNDVKEAGSRRRTAVHKKPLAGPAS